MVILTIPYLEKFSRGENFAIFANFANFAKLNPGEIFANSQIAKLNPRESFQKSEVTRIDV